VARRAGSARALVPLYMAAARQLGVPLHICNCSLRFQTPVDFLLVPPPPTHIHTRPVIRLRYRASRIRYRASRIRYRACPPRADRTRAGRRCTAGRRLRAAADAGGLGGLEVPAALPAQTVELGGLVYACSQRA
jgi:hypothetical protein